MSPDPRTLHVTPSLTAISFSNLFTTHKLTDSVDQTFQGRKRIEEEEEEEFHNQLKQYHVPTKYQVSAVSILLDTGYSFL